MILERAYLRREIIHTSHCTIWVGAVAWLLSPSTFFAGVVWFLFIRCNNGSKDFFVCIRSVYSLYDRCGRINIYVEGRVVWFSLHIHHMTISKSLHNTRNINVINDVKSKLTSMISMLTIVIINLIITITNRFHWMNQSL